MYDVPGQSLGLGAEGEAYLLEKRLRVLGEWNLTRFQPTNKIPTVTWQNPTLALEPQFLSAWRAEAEATLWDNRTRLLAKWEQVDPHYFSLGTPFLISDRRRHHFQWDQQFWEGKPGISAYWRKDQDHLVPFQNSRNTVSAGGYSNN